MLMVKELSREKIAARAQEMNPRVLKLHIEQLERKLLMSDDIYIQYGLVMMHRDYLTMVLNVFKTQQLLF